MFVCVFNHPVCEQRTGFTSSAVDVILFAAGSRVAGRRPRALSEMHLSIFHFPLHRNKEKDQKKQHVVHFYAARSLVVVFFGVFSSA